MASVFFPLTRVFASVRALFAWLAQGAAHDARPAQPQPPAGAQQHAAPPAPKPLRVVRVVEPSAPRSTAGRMFISGRLADVCAELDRLAALEAQGC